LLGNPRQAPRNALLHLCRNIGEVFDAAPPRKVRSMRPIAGLAFKIERGGLGAGARQSLSELSEHIRPMALALYSLPTIFCGFGPFGGPDIPIEYAVLVALPTRLRVDDRELDLDLLDTILAQCHGVAFGHAGVLEGFRQADTPKTVDRSVI